MNPNKEVRLDIYSEEIEDMIPVIERIIVEVRRHNFEENFDAYEKLSEFMSSVKNLVGELNNKEDTLTSIENWRKGLQGLPEIALNLGLNSEEVTSRVLERLNEEDKVNSPSHYNHGEIECIDAIAAALTLGELKGFVRGNVIKYLWRMEHKGGLEDLKKARWYLDYLINKLEGRV